MFVRGCPKIFELACVPFVICSIKASLSKPEAIPPKPRKEVFPIPELPWVAPIVKLPMIHPSSLKKPVLYTGHGFLI